ncbi:MAG: methylated-DNA--[protein]-cysteine S-methyltransferase [Deltaproteobacteria bacterium]|nr:methylated-DNA--[protein]-cysteine S-methyltransferase [Deltaproteobacteria bacterium]
MKLEIGAIDSPLGELRFARWSGRVAGLAFADRWPDVERALRRRLAPVELGAARSAVDLAERLNGYFDGDLAALDAIEIALCGTPFQIRVWTALRAVRAGTTTSYGALARAIGAASATRAVGAANGANPIWLVVPCHRAIGSDGRLVGYAGGVARKRWLLAHESAPAAGQRLVQNSEKGRQPSGPNLVAEIFAPGGTATGLSPSKRWSITPSKSVSSSWRAS